MHLAVGKGAFVILTTPSGLPSRTDIMAEFTRQVGASNPRKCSKTRSFREDIICVDLSLWYGLCVDLSSFYYDTSNFRSYKIWISLKNKTIVMNDQGKVDEPLKVLQMFGVHSINF
ncbi:hypothetical protein A2U01_0039803 [Trifolium medium]|uniref:Uncharacterized protein n=1 Tax=Trifolium medium TaxID=97028 RepID=A0A392Q3H4_9FABA|nr:hypothetical protein [Trifolium medium]